MTKERFAAELERAQAVMAAFPVTRAVLGYLLDELRKGDPAWWGATQKAWEKRRLTSWTEGWSLFMGCLHFEALSDAKSPLVPYFPSCGGTHEADPSGALAKFLAAPPRRFLENLALAQKRSYVEIRASLWVSPAVLFFQRRGIPFYVLEADSGAGLNIAVDAFTKPKGFDSDLVLARIGLDPAPLLLEDISHRRWMTAGLMPEQIPQIKALDRAMRAAREIQGRDPHFLQLAKAPASMAGPFISKNVPAGEEEGLLILNMGVTTRMTDAEYASYKEGLARMMTAWGDRALWVEVENVRGELYSTTTELRIGRLDSRGLKQMVMARFDAGSQKIEFHEKASAEFLY